MEGERHFLDAELLLAALSERLNASTHHLSQVINEQFNKSFSEFVNEYRSGRPGDYWMIPRRLTGVS